jgi:hypothetical protein
MATEMERRGGAGLLLTGDGLSVWGIFLSREREKIETRRRDKKRDEMGPT